MANFRAEWWTLKSCEELVNCFSVLWAIPECGSGRSKTLLKVVVAKELDIIKQWMTEMKKKRIPVQKSMGESSKAEAKLFVQDIRRKSRLCQARFSEAFLCFQITSWVPSCLILRFPTANQGSSVCCWMPPPVKALQLSLTWAVTLPCSYFLDKKMHFAPGTRDCRSTCDHLVRDMNQTPAFYKTLTYSTFFSAMTITVN